MSSYQPNSAAARDVAYLIHPYTNFETHESQGPLIIERGEGIYVYDDEGRRYIEGLAGLWCAGLGFSEKRLVEAAHRQLDTLPYMHTFAHRSCRAAIDLAEALITIAPAHEQGLLLQLRLGGNRQRDQVRVVLQQRP